MAACRIWHNVGVQCFSHPNYLPFWGQQPHGIDHWPRRLGRGGAYFRPLQVCSHSGHDFLWARRRRIDVQGQMRGSRTQDRGSSKSKASFRACRKSAVSCRRLLWSWSRTPARRGPPCIYNRAVECTLGLPFILVDGTVAYPVRSLAPGACACPIPEVDHCESSDIRYSNSEARVGGTLARPRALYGVRGRGTGVLEGELDPQQTTGDNSCARIT